MKAGYTYMRHCGMLFLLALSFFMTSPAWSQQGDKKAETKPVKKFVVVEEGSQTGVVLDEANIFAKAIDKVGRDLEVEVLDTKEPFTKIRYKKGEKIVEGWIRTLALADEKYVSKAEGSQTVGAMGAAKLTKGSVGYDTPDLNEILGKKDSLAPVHPLSKTATGTGRTTGHIADLVLSNLTDKTQNIKIGPFFIPSDGQYQPYIVPNSTAVTIPPGGTVKLPLEGYCTDVTLPPPPAGTTLNLPEDLSSNTKPDILDALQRIIRTAESLQRDGHLTTPISGNPEKERESVIQQTFWSYLAKPEKPYGFSEFCDRTRQLWQDVPNSTANPEPSLTEGINQIWNAVEQTGIGAGLPSFQPPLPTAASTPTPAPASSLPEVTSTITAKGTGRTTGHIADLTISNPTDKPVIVQFGPGSEPFDGTPRPPAFTPLFIPSSGGYQPYLIPAIPPVEIAPGQTITVPVQGFCTDIHRPPVPSGDGMTPISQWISSPGLVSEPQVHDPMNLPGASSVVVVPTSQALPLADAINILTGAKPKPKPETALPSPGHTSLSVTDGTPDCVPGIVSPTPVIPGTDSPMPFPVNPDQYPALAVPLLAEALNRIAQTYDALKPQGGILTPFSGNPEKEREAVIQQTFWRYSSALSGVNYHKEDFRNNTIRQFEQSTGKPVSQIPKPQQDKIDQGVDDFWNTFEAVGTEAKVLKVPPVIPPQPAVQNFWNNYNTANAKILP